MSDRSYIPPSPDGRAPEDSEDDHASGQRLPIASSKSDKWTLTEQMIVALFQADDIVEIRAFWPDREQTKAHPPQQRWCRAGDWAGLRVWLESMNANGYGVYLGVHPRKSAGGGSEADVALARCLFVDFDSGLSAEEALSRIAAAGLPRPTIIVMSGHGAHCYWMLKGPMTDLNEWRARQLALINILGSDKAVHDPPRVMRLPGTMNTKSKPVPCGVLEIDPSRRYSLDEFPSAAPERARTTEGGPTEGQRSPLSRKTLDFIAFGTTMCDRNGRLFTAACDMNGCGFSRGEAEAKLVGPAISSPGDHPFTEKEARDTIESAYGKGRVPARSPSMSAVIQADAGPILVIETWSDPKPLAASVAGGGLDLSLVLPSSLEGVQAFLGSVAHSIQVPVELPFMLALPMIGVGLAHKAIFRGGPEWFEPPALWTLCLCPSGERKSSTYAKVLSPLQQWQQEEAERLIPECAAAAELKRIKEAQVKKARFAAVKSENCAVAVRLAQELEAMRIPVVPSLITAECTTEALGKELAENDERQLVTAAEGDVLDTILGRYSDGKPNLGLWLAGHAGDAFTVKRVSRPPIKLRFPHVSVALTTQPENVEGLYLNQQARGRGFIPRLLAACPGSLVGYREINTTSVPDDLVMLWERIVRTLLDWPIDRDAGVVEIRLSPEASRLFDAFRREVEWSLREGEEFSDRRAFGSKFAGAVARIATIYHGMRAALKGNRAALADPIEVDVVRAAIQAGMFFAEQERSVGRLMGADPDVAMADKIIKWVRRNRHTEFSRRDAYSENRTAAFKRVDQMDGAFDLLVEKGYIRLMPVAPRAGRPSDMFAVNPKVVGGAGGAP